MVEQKQWSDLAVAYRRWSARRRDLSAREDTGGTVRPAEWERSDDEGIDLLDAVATTLGWGGR